VIGLNWIELVHVFGFLSLLMEFVFGFLSLLEFGSGKQDLRVK